jgi:hypothetical protein
LNFYTGGILTVADDFLQNDGRKFLDLMEHLAQKKLKSPQPQEENEEWEEYEGDSSNFDDDDVCILLLLLASVSPQCS